MKKNCDIIIAVGRAEIRRTDLGTGETKTLARSDRNFSVDEIVSAVAAGPVKRKARVGVASSDVFTQRVSLGARQVQGLSADEIDSALVFEIEPFSNLNRETGLLKSLKEGEKNGITTWRVVQFAKADATALQSALEKMGAKLAAVAALEGELPEKTVELPLPFIDFTQSAGKRILSPTAIGFTILGFILLGCAVHWFFRSGTIETLSSEVAVLERAESERARAQAALKRVEARIRDREKALSDQGALSEQRQRQRTAWSTFFSALSDHADKRIAFRSITSDASFSVRVTGVSATIGAAQDYMAELSAALAETGWRLRPEGTSGTTLPGFSKFAFVAELDCEKAE